MYKLGTPLTAMNQAVGELDLLWIVQRALEKGYQGAIGMELDPSKDTWSSLLWMNQFGYNVDPSNR